MSLQDPTLNLYNPATLDPEVLLAEFIDRKGVLERILDIIRHNGPDQPQQHVIVIGPRGMGKTTLLCAIKHSVETRDAALNAEWLPILFQEEQYGIGDLADFWLETIRHLEAALHRPSQASEQLLDENPDDLADRAQQRFFELLAETGKRALLLIDNLNDIFDNIDDGQALHTLRALWMTDPRCMVVGAAPSYFEAITAVDQAFHDFFRPFTLDRLSQEELESFLRGYAQRQGDDRVLRVIEQAPARVAALRILTGGNPRLVKLGYRVLRDGLDGDLRQDLERLLDAATPFFKHRIDSLKAKETRRVFDAIARRWDPVTVDDIRRELRKPSNYVSAQIKRLIDEGFVEEAGGDKKKRYQVTERFYNVYYLMRHSREGRRRLRWLVGFMQTFYTPSDFKDWTKRLEGDLAEPLAEPVRAEKLAHLHALSAAAGDGERGEVFEALVRDALAHDDRRALDEDTADGDPVETHGWRYLLAEVVWLLQPDARRPLGFRPNDEAWMRQLRLALGEDGLRRAQTHLDELGGWRQDTPRHARAAGVMLELLFQRFAEAEVAYRKALELNPRYAFAWINLGNALSGQSRHAEAETAFLSALELDPQDDVAWHYLGNARSALNQHAEAEAAFRKALELDPHGDVSWYNLGNELLNQSRYAEAESAYHKALELDPKRFDTWNNLGVVLNRQNCPAEAETAFRKALELNQQDYVAWHNLGSELYEQNRPAEAEVAYRKALELDPQQAYAWNNLGYALYDQNRPAEAEAACRQALELDPQYAYAWNNLGNALSRQNRPAEAEAAYRQALELDPQYAYAWNNLGNVLCGQNRPAEAEAAYHKALELNPQNGVAHINLGGTYLIDMGRIEEGANALSLGLALEPQDSYGRRVLSEHWQAIISAAAAHILARAATEPSLAENLRSALADTLLQQAAAGRQTAVRDALLALDAEQQAIFEPLLLALQALDDRSLLYRIAREKRELVLDVMRHIGGQM